MLQGHLVFSLPSPGASRCSKELLLLGKEWYLEAKICVPDVPFVPGCHWSWTVSMDELGNVCIYDVYAPSWIFLYLYMLKTMNAQRFFHFHSPSQGLFCFSLCVPPFPDSEAPGPHHPHCIYLSDWSPCTEQSPVFPSSPLLGSDTLPWAIPTLSP